MKSINLKGPFPGKSNSSKAAKIETLECKTQEQNKDMVCCCIIRVPQKSTEEEEETKQQAKDGTRIKITSKYSSIKQPTPVMSTPFCGAQMLAANNVGYYTQNNREKKSSRTRSINGRHGRHGCKVDKPRSLTRPPNASSCLSTRSSKVD
jgi:hypothetical protein